MKRALSWVIIGAMLLLLAAAWIRSRVDSPAGQDRPPERTAPKQQDNVPPVKVASTGTTVDSPPVTVRQADTLESVRNRLESLLARHRKSRRQLQNVTTQNRDSFAWKRAYGYTQARLLSLCFPAETEQLVDQILAQGKPELDDLILAAKLLGFLAAQGKTSVEGKLLQLTNAQDPQIIAAAVESLFSGDKEGRHRAVYWSKCSDGVLEVYDLGPYWADAQTKGMLQKIFDRDNTPESPDGFTKEALERLVILESGDRSEKLNQLLSGRAESGDYTKIYSRQKWALQVAQKTPDPAALEVLRQRLGRDEIAAATFMAEKRYEPVSPSQPGYVTATGDRYYDNALLAYFSLGGQLNDLQKQRLTYYGYLGDPKERLTSLMEEDEKKK